MTIDNNDVLVQLYIELSVNNIPIASIAKVATLEPIDLHQNDTLAIDGITLIDGDRVLIKDQEFPEQNGLYQLVNNQLVLDTSHDYFTKTGIVVESGVLNGLTAWVSDHVVNGINFIRYDHNDHNAPEEHGDHSGPIIQQTVNGPVNPLTVFNSDFGVSRDLHVLGKTKVSDLNISGKISFSSNNVNLDNATINDVKTGGLLLRVFKVEKNADIHSSFIASRQIFQTLTKSIEYNNFSSSLLEKENVVGGDGDGDLSLMFLGYIKGLKAESTVFYLRFSGNVQIWIGSLKLFDYWGAPQSHIDTPVQATFTFTDTTHYLPFTIFHRQSGGGNPLSLKWSFISSPNIQSITPASFAYSATEDSPVYHGPLQVRGKSTFYDDIHVKEGVKVSMGDLTGKDATFATVNIQNSNTDSTSVLSLRKNALDFELPTGSKFNIFNKGGAPTSLSIYGQSSPIEAKPFDTSFLNIGWKRDEKAYVIETVQQKGKAGPLQIKVDGSPSCIFDIDSSVSFMGNLQCGGDISCVGKLSVAGDFDLVGSMNPNRLHVSSVGASRDDVLQRYGGQLNITGPNMSLSGPHLNTFTSIDEGPLLNIASWAHDDISINMDCFYDGSYLLPSSSTASQIKKGAGKLQFNYYSEMENVFKNSFSVDLTTGKVMFSSPSTIFENTDGEFGSLQILPSESANGSTIAFFKTPYLQTSVTEHFWKIGHCISDDSFRFTIGQDNHAIIISNDKSVQFTSNISVLGGISSEHVIINGSADISGFTTLNEVYIEDGADAIGDGTAALVVNGGVHVGKSIITNEQLLAGRVHISSKSPRLLLTATETSNETPVLGGTVFGTRIILSPTVSPITTNVSLGVSGDNNNIFWNAIGAAMDNYAFRWYGGAVELLNLNGIGDLNLSGTNGSVSFTGLSSSKGMYLSPFEGEEIYINFASRWKIGNSISDEFSINNAQNVPIVSISSEKGLNVQGKLTVREGLSCTQITTNDWIMINNSLKLVQNGIVYKDEKVFNIASNGLSIGSTVALHVNSFSNVFAANVTSDTVINQNNNGKFIVYNNESEMMSINEKGTVLPTGSLSISAGDLTVSGSLSIANVITSNSISTSRMLFTGKSSEVVGFYMKTDDGTAGSFVLDSKNIKFECSKGIEITSQEVIAISTGTKVVVNGHVDLETLTWKNTLIGSTITNTASASPLSTFNVKTVLTARGVQDKWYYIGKLNTMVGGLGEGECGLIQLSLYGGNDSNGTDAVGITHFTASVRDGNVYAYHDFEGTQETSQSSRGNVYVFKNENDDNFGEYHVFVLCKCGGANAIDIHTFVSDEKPHLIDEGSGAVPDGKKSLFTYKWKLVYGTNTPSDSISRKGTIICDNDLHVRGTSRLVGDIHIAPDSTLTLGKLNGSESLHVYADNNLVSVFSNEELTCLKNIIPSTSNTLTLGSEKLEWQSLHTHDIFATNAMITGKSIFTGLVKVGDLQVEKAISVGGDVLIKKDIIVEGSLSILRDVSIAKGLHVNGNAVIDGDISFLSISGNKLVIADQSILSGDIIFSTGSRLVSEAFSPVQVFSSKLSLVHKDEISSLDAQGRILSSGHVSICPNEDVLAHFGQNGEIVFNPNVSKICNFIVNGVTKLNDKVHIANGLKVDKTVTLTGDLILENPRLFARSARLLDISENDELRFFVPHKENANAIEPIAALSLKKSGVYVSNGLFCEGKSHLKELVTESMCVSVLKIATPETSSDVATATVSIGRASESVENLSLSNVKGTLSTLISVGETGYKLAFSKENEKSVTGQLSFTSDGSLQVNCVNIKEPALKIIGSYVDIDSSANIRDGLVIGGEKSKNGKGLTILSDGEKGNAIVRFGNDTVNNASVCLYSSLHKTTPSRLMMYNEGGDVCLYAAGRKGLHLSGTSGNATFSGLLHVQSALDVQSAPNTDKVTAALNVAGGALVEGNMLIKKSLMLSKADGNGRVAISISSPSDLEENYSLTLPASLPEADGMMLMSDLNGRLQWGSVAAAATPQSTSPTYVDTLQTFSAANDVVETKPVTGLRMSGRQYSVVVNVVQVIQKENDNIETFVGSYDIKGVYTAKRGWVIKVSVVGDDIPIAFSVNNHNGQIRYKTQSVQNWLSTTLTWSQTTKTSSAETGRLVVGSDISVERTYGNDGAFFAVNGATFTESDAVSSTGSTMWSGTYFGRPILNLLQPTLESATADSYTASTVCISGSPINEGYNNKNVYALNVSTGVVSVGDTKDAVSTENAAMVVAGGLGVKKSMFVGDDLHVHGKLVMSGGSSLGKVRFGSIVIGSSTNAKKSSTTIQFDDIFDDNSYKIFGSVVSAINDDAVYVCSFKACTRSSCRVTVCRVDGDSWSDTSLTVHYYVIA